MNANNVGYTIEALRNSEGTYSQDLLQQAVDIYKASFEDEVPLSLLASAARSFRSSELMRSLLDRVKEEKPVSNWHDFSRKFLREKPSA